MNAQLVEHLLDLESIIIHPPSPFIKDLMPLSLEFKSNVTKRNFLHLDSHPQDRYGTYKRDFIIVVIHINVL